MFSRREMLFGVSLLALAERGEAQLPIERRNARHPPGGWNTLPLGCGGLVTGFDLATDGTMVCRTDVGNCYRWSGTTADVSDPSHRWVPLITYASMGTRATFLASLGAYELVIAPSRSTNLYGIMADNDGQTKWWVYRSTNRGALWTRTNLSMLNADSSGGHKKNAAGKIVVDPVNPDVVYSGMPIKSGNRFSIYRALDGRTFSPIASIGPTILDPGVCGMCFDRRLGTVMVEGQIRTARIIIPVGGVGIFESLDGGQTFTETAVAAMGGASISVYQGKMDYDGVYYAIVSTDGRNGYLWRYSGPGGAWVQLDAQPGWRLKPGWIGQGNLIVDPRNGFQGYLTASGPNGLGAGFTSTNANGPASSVRWGGATGGERPALRAPGYDVPWQNYGMRGLNAFLGGTYTIIDQNGVCWWSGHQGFWFFDKIPNYAASLRTVSNCVARGMEVTVAEDVCCPPGGAFPVLASQDVGIMRGTFTEFPTDYYVSGSRMDCQSIDWAATDPSFMVARVNVQAAPSVAAGALSAYSAKYGAAGTWVPYANQADLMYQGIVIGGIDNGSSEAGKVLNVTAVISGNVLIGQSVSIGRIHKGTITAHGTGTGGTGTYMLDTASLTAPGSLNLVMATQGGAVVAVDRDRHICVPSGYNGSFIPVYTTNATSRSCSWKFCSGLPQARWTNRSFVVGQRARPFAVDYVNIGTVYAALFPVANTTTIYRSIDGGATFSAVGTLQVGAGGNLTTLFLHSVPGHAGHLWLAAHFTGSIGAGLWRSTNGGDTWRRVAVPSPGVPRLFCLGAAHAPEAYPTLYCLTWSGYNTATRLYFSINQGATWSVFGPTGTQADLPPSCQVCGIQSMTGDWNVFKRLYIGSNQSGFAYYSP